MRVDLKSMRLKRGLSQGELARNLAVMMRSSS